MGILNVTPDSFFDGGQFASAEAALDKFRELKKFSDIIDVGGESTRPGASPITPKEELKRLLPVLSEILPEKDVKISIDTYHKETAETALKMGADIINAVAFSEELARVAAKYGATLALMARDTGGDFENTTGYLNNLISLAKESGVSEENIILDPGIGFLGGYKADLLALKNIPRLKKYYDKFPILVGVSRKSFIGEVLKRDKEERLIGSVAANLTAAFFGADILRVHDAKEMKDAIIMKEAVEEAESWTKSP